jgi:hypothetical protein
MQVDPRSKTKGKNEMNTVCTREAVYAAIDSERDYQDELWGDTLSGNRLPIHSLQQGGDRSIDEFILYLQGYMNDLVYLGSHFSDTPAKLEVIRKVTTLGVAAMEQHGAPHRNTTR